MSLLVAGPRATPTAFLPMRAITGLGLLEEPNYITGRLSAPLLGKQHLEVERKVKTSIFIIAFVTLPERSTKKTLESGSSFRKKMSTSFKRPINMVWVQIVVKGAYMKTSRELQVLSCYQALHTFPFYTLIHLMFGSAGPPENATIVSAKIRWL